MNADKFEAKMREFEFFHHLKALPGAWIILRMDGRAFHSFTADMEKPFDIQFHSLMCDTVHYLMHQFNALYGYTESDEISLVLPPTTQTFGREVEKLVSLSAGMTSAFFNLSLANHRLTFPTVPFKQAVPVFDSRLWMAPTMQDVVDYFRWRQADATRCCINGWAFWTLIQKDGLTRGKATSALRGKSQEELQELLFQRGTNFNKVPLWQRRGTGFRWTMEEKKAELPPEAIERLKKNGRPVPEAKVTQRRVLSVDANLPMKDAYSKYLRNIFEAAVPAVKTNDTPEAANE